MLEEKELSSEVTIPVSLFMHVIDKEIDDLYVIVNNFIDSIDNLEDNEYVKQNDALTIIKNQLVKVKKDKMTLNEFNRLINKTLTPYEKLSISTLDLEKEISDQFYICDQLQIPYFDLNKFLNVIEEEKKIIAEKYNLNGNDDMNKKIDFLTSMKIALTANDDALNSLYNKYMFYLSHDENSENPEYLTIHDNKIYSIELLNDLLTDYSEKIISEDKKNSKKAKQSKKRR